MPMLDWVIQNVSCVDCIGARVNLKNHDIVVEFDQSHLDSKCKLLVPLY